MGHSSRGACLCQSCGAFRLVGGFPVWENHLWADMGIPVSACLFERPAKRVAGWEKPEFLKILKIICVAGRLLGMPLASPPPSPDMTPPLLSYVR
jgi:hypothetical protein